MVDTTAKEVAVSNDGGANFYTLPGDTADVSFERSQETDTIFGSIFTSTQPTIASWSISGNARWRGFPGYKATIKKTGTATSFSGESASQVDGQLYEIDDSTKSVWDWTQSVTINDGGSPVSDSDIARINYIFGRVEFASGYTVSGPITIEGNYLPLSTFGRANEYTINQSADTTDTSDFETVNSNGGFMTMRPTLLTADIDLSGFYRASNQFFEDVRDSTVFVIEIDPNGADESIARGIYKLSSVEQSGDVGGDETYSVSATLSVPGSSADGFDVRPFDWVYNNTSMPEALKIVQDAWLDRTDLTVRYLPEGTGNEGREGTAIVTETSLSASVDGLVEASVTFEGDGTLTGTNLA